jgi:hypothetical protein
MLAQEEKSNESKVRTVFLMRAAEREALEKLSAASGAPISELLRRSVTSYLQAKAQA